MCGCRAAAFQRSAIAFKSPLHSWSPLNKMPRLHGKTASLAVSTNLTWRLRSICCSTLKVLDEVRPYLIADGGNVRVMGVDVDRRVVSRLGGLGTQALLRVSCTLISLIAVVYELPLLRSSCYHEVTCCCRSVRHPTVALCVLFSPGETGSARRMW